MLMYRILLPLLLQLFFMFDRSDSVEGDYSFQFMGDVSPTVCVTCVCVTCVVDLSLMQLLSLSVLLLSLHNTIQILYLQAPIARQDSVVMGDSDISANMGDEGWNF
jgi:hypothetical protein